MIDGGSEQDTGCQICAEEIDPADQHFVPCKCGYQICVWCWHQIVDMAEKDASNGICPACRQPYEKERIAMMQAIGERLVSEAFNRKTKQPKAKRKANEVKDLTNIRVIQRKVAYVTGLPLSLADEDVLPRKDNFGQYGRVTKVSLSRTTGGAIQQFSNDTCSVYITYAKEEEALRCIHAVHDFVLDGRILRASFGTKKYCHAWLKHTPCNNPACLYLHRIGPDEDSFGKDEDAAEYTRSRVQQIAGAGNNVIPRSGTALPPPIDDVHIRSSTFSDKSTARSSISDGAHGSGVGTSDMHPSKDKEGPSSMTGFTPDHCPVNDQSLAPPRFSMPYRDPPPGFSIPSSGGEASTFLTTSPLPLGAIHGSSSGDANFIVPENLPSGQGNQTNGFQNTMFEAKPYATPELNVLVDESRFWLLMQQSASACQDSNLSKIFAHQIPLLNR